MPHPKNAHFFAAGKGWQPLPIVLRLRQAFLERFGSSDFSRAGPSAELRLPLPAHLQNQKGTPEGRKKTIRFPKLDGETGQKIGLAERVGFRTRAFIRLPIYVSGVLARIILRPLTKVAQARLA